MRNKLVFPNGGTETKYAWDRYSLTREGQHIWDKCKVVSKDVYYWDKYAVKGQDSYTWDKYNVEETHHYSWNKYGLTTTSNNVYNVYKVGRMVDTYFRFSSGYELTDNLSITAPKGKNYYLFFYNKDGTVKTMFVDDMIERNLYIDGLLALGYYGCSHSKNSINPDTKPRYLFTSPYTHLYVEGTNLRISDVREVKTGEFKRFYWTTQPSDFNIDTDFSPTIYPPETLIDTVIMDEANKVSYYTKNYDKIYVAQNDGFWYSSGNGKIIDKSNLLDTYTSTNKEAYSEGMYSDYFLQFDSETVEYSRGSTHYGEVVSTNGGQYPRDDQQDGYWYVLQLTGTYIWNTYNTAPTQTWDMYNVKTNYDNFISGRASKCLVNKTGITVNCLSGYDASFGYKTGQTIQYNSDNIYSISCVSNYDLLHQIPSDYPSDRKFVLSEDHPLILGLIDEDNIVERTDIVYFIVDYLNKDREVYYFVSNDTKMIRDNSGNIFITNLIEITTTERYGRQIFPYQNFSENFKSKNPIYPYDIGEKDTTPTLFDYEGDFTWTDIVPPKEQEIWLFPIYIPEARNIIPDQENRDWTDYFELDSSYQDYDKLKKLIDSELDTGYYQVGDYCYTIRDKKYEKTRYSKIIGSVSSTDLNAYPQDGEQDGFWYVHSGVIPDATTFIGEAQSREKYAYPYNGEIDGVYYVYSHLIDDTIQLGDFIEQIESTNENAYPKNNVYEDYWYIYSHKDIIYLKGDKIGSVNSISKNEYPVYGKLEDNWYVYIGYENNGPYKSHFIDQVETNQQTSYPLDGIDGNYWYVYNKSYTGYKAQILDNQIIGGINYQHNINPQSDATIGNVGMAKVDFTYDNVNDDFQQYIDLDYFLYYTWQKNDSDWRLIGKFFIDDVSYNRTRAKITAYDSICKAEKFVDDFIKQTTFPITLQAFYNNLLTYLGLENGGFLSLNMSDFSNLKQQIKDNFQAINITGRQILQYIAEMAGGYCLADKNGKIIIGDYSGKNTYPLNSSKYKKYEASKFEPERVRYVCAKMNTDDLGVAVGNADLGEEYIIENNPLFYTENENEIKPALTNLMNLLYRFTGGYKPGTIELLEDFGIEVGDRVVIGNNYFYVMSKTMSASGCKLECFGNKHREKQAQSINSEIVALRGKTNELVRDLEKTQSTLTDTANGLQSQITQTASQIRSEVKNNYDGLSSSITQTASQIRSEVNDTKNELSSTIEQTASSITATVSNNKQELESKIEQTASSISSTVSQQGQVISQIKQDLDGISLTYNSEQGTASITIGDITISELVDGKYVDRVVAGIDFSGYCRFSDLSTPGQTIICGDNITTGTISADRINLTGSISWGDLSSSCKDTIASYAGADGSDAQVPSYIHNTYIDATTIKSPTIYGAKIYAGTNAEGYIKLASTGMNFYSNTGGSVCGIGYYPGKYNLPYIMLGQGVDDAGTDKGMIKKYTNGIWIGDSDNVSSDSPGGTGIFINFTSGKIQKYINGSVSTL